MSGMEAMDTTSEPAPRSVDPVRRALAWAVHLFTASGAVLGVLALLAISEGNLARATLYMLITLAIDSTDGTFARLVGVSRHLPHVDGRRLDDIIDYLNFVIVPALFMIQAGTILSPVWVALPVLASAFGFSRDDAKTDDDFFLGFPSYWNILAFYLWLLGYSPLVGTIWVIALSIAVFIPYKYIYPSKLKNLPLRYFTCYSGLLWSIVVGWAVLNPEIATRHHVVAVSLVYPAFYMLLSFKLGGMHRWGDAA
jgi:phosphatidylcholine synthase